MERHIQKYFKKIVDKVKSERKKQKLSQKRLSAISGISTQTISRFEQAEEDIQVSTVINLADILGLHLEVAYPYSFKVLVYKLLIDTLKTGDSKISKPSQTENDDPVFFFLTEVATEMKARNDLPYGYPIIDNWEKYCDIKSP